MTPFCGYNMGDYFQHWFEMGDKLGDKAPRIFYVNWFRKSPEGKWLWPGYGENSRVLKWMCDRVAGKAEGRKTPIGILPKDGELDLTGLSVAAQDLAELMKVDPAVWKAELTDIEAHFKKFGDRLPKRLSAQLAELKKRLG
jgi:phosphoenolpyruvate carboxykinase (GTP)